jgi:hypothetical protein
MEADDEHIVSGGVNEKALKNARRIDDCFEDARLFCVSGLRRAFKPWEGGLGRTEAGRTPEELVKNILARDYEVDISTLERITSAADQMVNIDSLISRINRRIRSVSPALIAHLPGVSFDEFEGIQLIQPTQFFDRAEAEGQPFTPQLVFLRQRLRFLCSYAPKLRDIIHGRGSNAYQEALKSLGTL